METLKKQEYGNETSTRNPQLRIRSPRLTFKATETFDVVKLGNETYI